MSACVYVVREYRIDSFEYKVDAASEDELPAPAAGQKNY